MSTLYYYIAEDRISFTRNDNTEYVEKNEFISFIQYLKNKENVVIDQRIVRGMFNKYDLTYIAKEVLEIIKNNDIEKAYEEISKYYNKGRFNMNHKLMPKLENIFFEDLVDYLKINNVDNYEEIAKDISLGQYKMKYGRNNHHIISDNFDMWARSCKFLPKRKALFDAFKSEYKEFDLECDEEMTAEESKEY